jgi:predicted transcriptional regulator
MTNTQYKQKRISLGLSQVKIAPYFGATSRKIQRIEAGESPVPENSEFIFNAISANIKTHNCT